MAEGSRYALCEWFDPPTVKSTDTVHSARPSSRLEGGCTGADDIL